MIAEGAIDNAMTTNSLESSHRTLGAMGKKHQKRFWPIWIDIREFLGTVLGTVLAFHNQFQEKGLVRNTTSSNEHKGEVHFSDTAAAQPESKSEKDDTAAGGDARFRRGGH